MGDGTGIEWTDATWNPTRGCSRISPGCKNCYAERVATRFSGPGKPYEGLVTLKGTRGWNGKVRMIDTHLRDPLAWQRPRRIFVNSMSDLFHEHLLDDQIDAVFGIMASAPRHTFQILTKRADRARDWHARFVRHHTAPQRIYDRAYAELVAAGESSWSSFVLEQTREPIREWPLSNVWMGVSVEDRKYGIPRIDELRQIPTAVRFLSIEPLLEDLGELDLSGIHWVIVGCESGPGARPCKAAWIRRIWHECRRQHVALFLKQANEEIEPPDEEVRYPHRAIAAGDGSQQKGRLIKLPYLDGVQHAKFPSCDTSTYAIA